MRYLSLSILIILFPVSLSAQLTDTIPLGGSIMKGSGDFIYETAVDTASTLVINELLASNSGSHYDNYGDADDWFEIYNYGDDPVRLNNLYFTDDPAEPLKWSLDTLVDLELDPLEHFIIWADDEAEEGYNHASFKLSGEGE